MTVPGALRLRPLHDVTASGLGLHAKHVSHPRTDRVADTARVLTAARHALTQLPCARAPDAHTWRRFRCGAFESEGLNAYEDAIDAREELLRTIRTCDLRDAHPLGALARLGFDLAASTVRYAVLEGQESEGVYGVILVSALRRA